MTRDHRPLIVLGLCVFLGLAIWSARSVPPVEAQAGCIQLIADGGFESEGIWQLGRSAVPPSYVTDPKHGGARALKLGIVGAPNAQTFSSARQTVTIPAGAGRVLLSYWFYAVYTGTPGTDYMELVLLAPDGYTILDKIWYAANDSRSWNQLTFDITRWRGNTLQVYFNVYNDGLGGVAGMYLDDVSLLACDVTGSTPTPTGSRTPTPTTSGTPLPTHTPTATPSPVAATPTATATPIYVIVTATATATPYYVIATSTATPYYVLVTPTGTATAYYVLVTPTGTATPYYVVATPTQGEVYPPPLPVPPPPDCIELIQNGGFEQGLTGWTPGRDPVPVQLSAAQVHTGVRSLMLGQNGSNVLSYSSARQLVDIPVSNGEVLLEFWTWTWAGGAGADHQEADFLGPDLGVLQKLWRPLANEQAWVLHQIPVTQYAGRTVWVYFNAYNDGGNGASGMYLDDVSLLACGTYAVEPNVQVEQPVPLMVLVTSTPTPGPLVLLVTPTSSVTIGAEPAVALVETFTPTPATTVIALPEVVPEVVTVVPTATPVPGFAQAVGSFIREIWPRPWWMPFAVILGLILVVILLRWLLANIFYPPP